MREPQRKIIDRETAAPILDVWRKNGDKIVFTNGCFDILHPGHIQLLFAARALGDRLIIGINSDDSVRRLKGNSRPVLTLDERAYILAAVEAVDMVVPFDEDIPLKLIEMLKPDILVKGEDYTVDEIVGADEVRATGGEVVRLPLREGSSTTSIIERIGKLYER